MYRNVIYGALAALLVLAVGCTRDTEDIEPETSPLSPPPQAKETGPETSPLLPSAQISPLPAPTPPPLPEPAPGLGVVSGRFVLELGGSAIIGATSYLGVVDEVQENFTIARLDTQTAPKAITDETGRFVFVDVPPGRYALIYETPVDTYLARYPSGEDVVVDVEAGKLVDLGVIYTPLLDQ